MYMRLMNEMEDFEALRINPKRVEPWEDQRRAPATKNSWDLWIFDAVLDDGRHLTVNFSTKPFGKIRSGKDLPTIEMTVTDGGEVHHTVRSFDPVDCTYGEDGCSIGFDDCSAKGDLRTYEIEIPGDEDAASFTIANLTKPFRPGTGVFDFGHDARDYFGIVCPVTRGEISGTVTVDGETTEIHGLARHLHLWGNVPPTVWNHGLVAWQYADDATLMIMDLTSARSSGFVRYPMCFVQNSRGTVVFDSTFDAHCTSEIVKESDDAPTKVHYVFESPDGSTVTYDLEADGSVTPQNLDVAKAIGTTHGTVCEFDTQGDATLERPKREDRRSRRRERIMEARREQLSPDELSNGAENDAAPDAKPETTETDASDDASKAASGGDNAAANETADEIYDPAGYGLSEKVTTSARGDGMCTFVLFGKTYHVEHSPQVQTEYLF